MAILQVQGDAFSEYYLEKILPADAQLAPRLDSYGAERHWRATNDILRRGHREMRGARQARVTRRLLLEPLAQLFEWQLSDPEVVATSLGEEDGSQTISVGTPGTIVARVLAIPPESSMDLPPEGFHRRFAPAHSLLRILEQEGLTWGILLNAFELRVVRRGEGFVSSHLSFALLDLAADLAGARDAWQRLWGFLRADAWVPGSALLDEVVKQGRDHQQEVGSLLGQQVPIAVERLLQGAIDHPANQDLLQPFLADPSRRQGLLEYLHAGALRYLYRVLFVLYAESRGLLPLDMPAYRDGYALTGAHGLVRKAIHRETDPREAPEGGSGYFEYSLRALFSLLRNGIDLGAEGRIPAYGGGLFYDSETESEEYPAFDQLSIGDRAVAHVLELLTRVETRRGKVTLSYRELDVEQLGALYEGLLERTVEYVDEAMGRLWRVRLDGDIVLVTDDQLEDLRSRRGETGNAILDLDDEEESSEDSTEQADEQQDEADEDDGEEPVQTGKKKPIRVMDSRPGEPNPIPAGSVVLRPGLGRKQSGSYYTNAAFVEYLVRRAVDPLAEGKSPEEILKLSVCDPAMGSGHFLVGACRRLAEHLLIAYKTRFAEAEAEAKGNAIERYSHELMVDAGVHAEVAAVWGNEPAELTVCRRLVAFRCLYGVDKNPLAVELARVSLWLATAASDHPLTFLNHRLLPGDSLLGITIEDLFRGFYRSKVKCELTGDEPKQGELPFYFTRDELGARLLRAFRHLREIERLETEQPGDFQDQQSAWLTMRQELEEFREAHFLRIGRAFLDPDDPARDPKLANRWMQDLQDHHLVRDETRSQASGAIAKGKELGAFCWELAFPECFFDSTADGGRVHRRATPGFHAIVGNPPWDKIEPKRKEFFAAYDPAIRDFQGQTLARRISAMAPQNSARWKKWREYESIQGGLAKLLTNGGIYPHQVAVVNGEKTGGKPDLSKFFLERSFQLLADQGLASLLLPAGLVALEGATGLRRMLLSRARIIELLSFENAFEKFFPNVDSRTKFITLTFAKEEVSEQSFPSAFMLRDERFLSLPDVERSQRLIRISSGFILLTNPVHLSLVDLRDDRERQFVERIYRDIPPLSKVLKNEGSWNVEFHRELNMTDDAWRFRTREWLRAYSCDAEGSAFVAKPAEWYESRGGEFVRGVRYVVPEGTKYRITSQKPEERERKRGSRGREVESVRGFLRFDRTEDEEELPIVPGARYVPLYEGRMVHQFDHAAKAYVSGEGRGAKWRDLDFTEKALVPHYYVDGSNSTLDARAGFCDVTGQTNERSVLATLLPPDYPAGNSVPTVTAPTQESHLVWVASVCSFAAEFLIRQKISTHLNFFYVEAWPVPRPAADSPEFNRLAELAAQLVSFTPEINVGQPAIDLRQRAQLRAEIDSIINVLYSLSVEEFGYVLTTFPLLDRDQPPLPDDAFVRWNKKGKEKLEPRSYVTRDTALLAYFRHKNITPPTDLAEWYRDAVGVDMLGDDSCPFRMGPIRNLEERVEEHYRRGAIGYVPSKAKRWNSDGPYQPPDLPADWQDWVVEDPEICRGRPTIRGTRLEVDQIAALLGKQSFSGIAASFPQLEPAQIAVAVHRSTRG